MSASSPFFFSPLSPPFSFLSRVVSRLMGVQKTQFRCRSGQNGQIFRSHLFKNPGRYIYIYIYNFQPKTTKEFYLYERKGENVYLGGFKCFFFFSFFLEDEKLSLPFLRSSKSELKNSNFKEVPLFLLHNFSNLVIGTWHIHALHRCGLPRGQYHVNFQRKNDPHSVLLNIF